MSRRKKALQYVACTIREGLGIKYYSDYIKNNYTKWWGKNRDIYCSQNLSECIETIYSHKDDVKTFRCCPLWQRRLTNKLSSREFAIKYNVPVPALYWYGKNADEIPFDRLPQDYVIKTSFGSSSTDVIPVSKGLDIFDNKPCTPDQVKGKFRESMSGVFPYGYIMVEEFVMPPPGGILCKDYKCHVFAGNVAYIEVIDRINGVDKWYTPDWSEPPRELGTGKFEPAPFEPPPRHLQDLITYAERLGRAYGPEYVRIDFYLNDKGCVFGEFTATPNAGLGMTAYGNRKLGKLWSQMPITTWTGNLNSQLCD